MKKYVIILLFIFIISIVLCVPKNSTQNTIEELYKEKKYETIIQNYESNLYKDLSDFNKLSMIADSYFEIENYEKSKTLYAEILVDKSINDLDRANLLHSYAMVLVKLKDIDAAFEVLQEGVVESEADLTTMRKLKRSYGLLARAFPREYNVENALTYLKDVIDLDITGDDYEANYSYALLLYYAEEYDLSLKYAQNTLRIKFDYYPAETLIPKIYFESGNVEKAISYLNNLILKYPTDPSFKLYLAQIYELTEDLDLALKQYKKTLEFDKENIDAHMGLIRVYISQNKINALIDELVIFSNTFPEDNKYSEIINKLIEKYFPKVMDKEGLKELEEEQLIYTP